MAINLQNLFINIANAIRSKDGTTDLIQADKFPEKIKFLETGMEATATANNILSGKTAAIHNQIITGTMPNRNTVGVNDAVGVSQAYPQVAVNSSIQNLQCITNLDNVTRVMVNPPQGYYNGDSYVGIPTSNLGTATAAQVLSGSTFTSAAGLKVNGTLVVQTCYVSSSQPVATTGNEGDLWLVTG